jgi:competence protein ComEA
MEAQIAEEKVEPAAGVGGEGEGEGGQRLWARVRAAVADSAWGSLVGKGVLYAAGFVLLAAVGSGRIRCLSAPDRAPGTEASAAPPSASALSGLSAVNAPPAPPEGGPDAGAEADAGGESGESGENQPAKAADAGAEGGLTKDGKVVLNRATEEDLRHLPGIGATRARAVLALRAKLGRFSRVEELLRVKGIGRRSLARLRPKVLLD